MSLFDKLKPKYFTCPYALAGETYPHGTLLKVFNKGTGDEIIDVVECNAREGWLIQYIRDGNGSLVVGNDGKVVSRKIKGYFEIRLYPK